MPRMLDLIRTSQVPVNLMQSAARGSLSVPPGEMIEILVYLALHHKLFGPQARLTLAGWDEKASLAAASDPATSAEVLGYFVALENLRPHLLPALLENPAVTEESLSELAAQGTRSVVDVLLTSPRIMNSPILLKALQSNPSLRPNELTEVGNKLAAFEASPAATSDHLATSHDEGDTPEAALEEALANFLKENAAELEKEKDKPFQPIGEVHETMAEATAQTAAPAEADAGPGEAKASAPEVKGAHAQPKTGAAAAAAKKHAHPAPAGEKRDSTLQKIARLDVKGRIALAMRGSKEERSILIRDGTKLVAVAVLDSPKVSEGEVENFAQQKNVLEAVLRAIPLKRQFAKNYSITRNLVYNPRTPLDLSLSLVKHLLVHDLKNLSGNKEVSETIRKVALRMFRQKIEKRG